MRRSIPILALLLIAPVALFGENDGNVCSLGSGDCRALEAALVSPRNDGFSLAQTNFAVMPTAYFSGNNMYIQAHVSFNTWRPPGVSYCTKTNGALVGETRVQWQKLAVTPGTIYSPATLVGRVAPCSANIGNFSDPERGKEIGGGEGTGFAYGGLYYQVNGTYHETLPSNTSKTCTEWNESCFPGLYIGAGTTPTAFPSYMLARLLSIYDFGGVRRGFHLPRFTAFDASGVPNPPASVFPRQSYNGTPAAVFGYVSWGDVPGYPGYVTRAQIVDVPDGLTRPAWQSTRVFLVDSATGNWRIVPTGGKPDFAPEAYNPGDIDYFAGAGPPQPFYLDAISGWQIGVDRDYSPADVTRCVDRVPVPPKANSTAGLRSMTSTNAILYTNSTSTKNGAQIGSAFFRIPGYTQVYLLRGSTERICTEPALNWWMPWIGGEITVEQAEN